MCNHTKQMNHPPKGILLALVACLSALLCAATASEESKPTLPLFELGLGVGGVSQPFYPGVSEQRNLAFPIPVPIYRGRTFKSDGRRVRAEVLGNARYELDVSTEFNLAVAADDVDLRKGMTDIGSLVQIGPALRINLWTSDQTQVKFNLPVRANIEIGGDRGFAERGFSIAPTISYRYEFEWLDAPWSANVALGPKFSSERFHDLYYGVSQPFAEENRAAFSVNGGYSGSRLSFSLRSRNKDRLWVWFLRYDNIAGSEFDDSPLVDTNDNVQVGFIYSRFVFRSKRRVPVEQ